MDMRDPADTYPINDIYQRIQRVLIVEIDGRLRQDLLIPRQGFHKRVCK